jgi:hypothetical protein
MFRKSKAYEIGKFFALPMEKNELAVFYLGVSGFIARSANQTVLFDPAGMLKDDEVKALKAANLLLYSIIIWTILAQAKLRLFSRQQMRP